MLVLVSVRIRRVDMCAMQTICPSGIDVHMQSTELHGQQGNYRYDDKQCGTSAHSRIIHEALWITNFVTRRGRVSYDLSTSLISKNTFGAGSGSSYMVTRAIRCPP